MTEGKCMKRKNVGSGENGWGGVGRQAVERIGREKVGREGEM